MCESRCPIFPATLLTHRLETDEIVIWGYETTVSYRERTLGRFTELVFHEITSVFQLNLANMDVRVCLVLLS